MIHTNQRRNIDKERQYQTGACTLGHDKANTILWKNNAISFPANMEQYCSIDVRAGR